MIPLSQLEVYKIAMEIGDLAWDIVDKWPFSIKDTLGKQHVRSADSKALNIAEGNGRYFYKENKVFCFFVVDLQRKPYVHFIKARKRVLLTFEEADLVEKKMYHYFILMAGYIKSIGRKSENQ